MLLRLLALAALLGLGASGSRVPADARPNFVFILSDDHRWDALGAAGNPSIRTPHLDSLAREGVYFRQGTVHVPQCSPGRACLMTGLPPHLNGQYSNQYQREDLLRADALPAPTLPGLLRDAGYRTVLTGKWHLRAEPWNSGFTDVRLWLPGGGGPFRNPGLARGNTRKAAFLPGYTQQHLATDAVEFLEGESARERPFLVWLSFTAPHLPMGPVPPRVSQQYQGKTPDDLTPPGFPKETTTRGGDWLRYNTSVTHLDEQVGRVLTALDERGLARNTVVVFLGDNGYMMGSREWNGKVVPYEESIRVPFIVRAPGVQKRAGVSEAPVSSLDLPPTLLALAGVPVPAAWPGRDLRPALRGEEGAVREAFCEWADNRSTQFGHLGYRVARTAAYKLIDWEQPEKPDELYDLVADPREAKNVIAEASAAGVLEDMRGRLRAWMERTEDPARLWRR